jgi:hypothetical protein
MTARAACFLAIWIAAGCDREPVELGFWFEPVSYSSPRIGDPISAAELAAIESIAREEIAGAFAPFRVIVSDNHAARYSVRVVPAVKDDRLQRGGDVAGASNAMPGLGGNGRVSFEFLANGAMVFSPPTATREDVLDAVGRGIGRVAIHEFLHQLLPKTPIHDSRDARTYEGNSPALLDGYFGELHWGLAKPPLEQRVGKR